MPVTRSGDTFLNVSKENEITNNGDGEEGGWGEEECGEGMGWFEFRVG